METVTDIITEKQINNAWGNADFEDSVEINTNNYQRDLSYPKDNNFGENDDDLKK